MNSPLQPPTTDFCARAQELALMTLDGDLLSELDRAFLDKHLLDCETCHAYNDSMDNLIGSLQTFEAVPVPAGLADRIMAQLEPASAAKVVNGRFNGFKKWMPVAAAALLLAVSVPMVTSSLNTPGNPQTASRPAVENRQVAMLPSTAVKTAPSGQSESTPAVSPAPKASSPVAQSAQLASVLGHSGIATLASANAAAPAVQPRVTHTLESVAAAPQRTAAKTSSHPAVKASSQARTAIASAAGSSGNSASGDTTYRLSATVVADSSELASAAQDAFGGEGEGDLYYDPMTSLVGY